MSILSNTSPSNKLPNRKGIPNKMRDPMNETLMRVADGFLLYNSMIAHTKTAIVVK